MATDPRKKVVGELSRLGDDTPTWLLLDSRVVDVPMTHNPTVIMLSSVKLCFFNSLQNALRCSANVGAEDPGIQEARSSQAEVQRHAHGLSQAIRRRGRSVPTMTRGRYDPSLSNRMLCSRYAESAPRARGSPGLGDTPAQGWAR